MDAPWREGLQLAGPITAKALNVAPVDPPPDRVRHAYGHGPFARLKMPTLPDEAGLYIWTVDDVPVYVGQTRGSLRSRLGSNGYATISIYNTFARQPGRTNGGQQTNCRVNALANAALASGHTLALWYRTTDSALALAAETAFLTKFGKPPWNR